MDLNALNPTTLVARGQSPPMHPFEFTEEDGAFLNELVFSPRDLELDAIPADDFSLNGLQLDDDTQPAATTQYATSAATIHHNRNCIVAGKRRPPLTMKTASFDSEDADNSLVAGALDCLARNDSKTVSYPNDNDILCIRGAGGNSHPGNVAFRQIIHENKPIFDSLQYDDKMQLVEGIWKDMKEKGTRFLKQSTETSEYDVLDNERSVRKILFALRDCRVTGKPLSKQAAAASVDGRRKSSAKKVSKTCQKQRPTKPRESIKPKDFDEVAKAEIEALLNRKELRRVMKDTWGDELPKKKPLIEAELLRRYRSAAQNGMPTKTFSSHLVLILMDRIKD